MLAVLETHPVQYHAPVYRCLSRELGVPLTVVYGSDFSVTGYEDEEFDAAFAWDTDLLSGYESVFLRRVADGGAQSYPEVDASGLADTLEKINPSAVLSIGYRHPYDRAGLQCVKKNGWPLLFRSETTDHALARSRLKAFARDVVLRRLYRRCSTLLYIGQRSKNHYERLGVAGEKLLFAPYCIDSSTFRATEEDRSRERAETRKELGINADRNVILYSGKLSYRKGVDQLLEAVKKFPQELRNNSTVLFLGDGPERESLAGLAKSEPAIDARFLGFHNQTELSGFYHASDLLTLPSRYSETWGLVVNEALLHGLPCVVSDAVGCHPDLVVPGATGEVFRTADVAAFSSALQACLQYSGAESTRSACRDRVKDYSVSHAARGISEAYARVTS